MFDARAEACDLGGQGAVAFHRLASALPPTEAAQRSGGSPHGGGGPTDHLIWDRDVPPGGGAVLPSINLGYASRRFGFAPAVTDLPLGLDGAGGYLAGLIAPRRHR